MGQYEILEFLEKCSEPMSVKEIAEGIDDTYHKVCKRIKTLLKHKEVKCIELSQQQGLKRYEKKGVIIELKRRMRLYYI